MTLAYFLKPFPKAEGFSAYRMPGLAVHVPVLILCAMAGVLLGRDSTWQPAFLVIYLIVGLYGGRDVAILAHYNLLVSVVVWISFLTLLLAPQRVSGWASAIQQVSPLPLIITAAMLAAFVAHVARWSRAD